MSRKTAAESGACTATGTTGASTEKLLEEIAEARAFELKIIILLPSSSGGAGAGPACATGLGTWLATGFPVGAELIILRAAFRIAQNLIGLVDLLEFFLRRFFVLGDIRMIFARKRAKGLLDVVRRGGLRDAENFVIVFEFKCHGRSVTPLERVDNLHTQPSRT